jgi:butanol dehydrogenase
MLEHEVSAYTDLTHGIGLAIIHPQVIKFYYEQDQVNQKSLIKYENLAKNVFSKEKPDDAVKEIAALFKKASGVSKLSEVESSNFPIKDCATHVYAMKKGLEVDQLIEIFKRAI